jgi:hypothetical protein
MSHDFAKHQTPSDGYNSQSKTYYMNMLPLLRGVLCARPCVRLIYDYVATSDGAFYTFLTARFIAFADA